VNTFFKVAALVLLSCLLAFPLAAMPLTMHSSQPTGECHHGGEIPAPQRSNYTCCQAGHNSAILQSQHVQQIVVLSVLSTSAVMSLRTLPNGISGKHVLPTYEPPGRSPLRI
jgi:hypothetical protein